MIIIIIIISNNVNNYKVIVCFFHIPHRFQPLIIDQKRNSKQFHAEKQKNR